MQPCFTIPYINYVIPTISLIIHTSNVHYTVSQLIKLLLLLLCLFCFLKTWCYDEN